MFHYLSETNRLPKGLTMASRNIQEEPRKYPSLKMGSTLLGDNSPRPSVRTQLPPISAVLSQLHASQPAEAMITLKSGSADLNSPDRGGNTPLMVAIQKDYPEIIDYLIEQSRDGKLDINAENKVGLTPLWYAVNKGNSSKALIEKLILAGAKVDINPPQNADILTLALLKEVSLPIFESLLKAHGPFDPLKNCNALETAVMSSDADYVQKLLKAGARSQEMNLLGFYVAHNSRNLSFVKELPTYGVDLSYVHPEKGTPLLNAILHSNPQLIDELIRLNVSVNQADKNGTTPLLLATFQENWSLAEKLIEKGADPSLCNLKGQSPKAIAEQFGVTFKTKF
jgi:uncharacterized protein